MSRVTANNFFKNGPSVPNVNTLTVAIGVIKILNTNTIILTPLF